jgi:hypothetical protein
MKKVVRAMFDDPHGVEAKKVAESQDLKKLIKQHAPVAIQLALDARKTYASLFEINDSACYVDLHKKEWINALETCLLWYVEDENYEMCTKIKDLINNIKKRGKNNRFDLNDGEGF